MRPSFLPRLVNRPFGDPGVFVPLTFHKRALLFDLGDVSGLSPGDLIKTSHVFISHTHMDHFVGFDHLLRLLLGRPVNLHLFGPSGFLDNLSGKLRAYTWNLVHNYREALRLTATEIRSDQKITQVFDGREGFAPSTALAEVRRDTTIHEESAFCVGAEILDHRIDCLAFAMQERFHVNILKNELMDLGLPLGPWVNRFKDLLYQKADPASVIEVSMPGSDAAVKTLALGLLAEKIARITPGQKFAYVTDAAYNEANREKIVALALDADQLFIEAAFLEEDLPVAMDKCHLTARQAGTLAREARVRAMTIFHHSPRYFGRGHLLAAEALEAFEGVR
jgi:ribonuclease Z